MDIEREVADLVERVAALEAVVMNASASPEAAQTAPGTPGPVFLLAGTPVVSPEVYPPPSTPPTNYPRPPEPAEATTVHGLQGLKPASFERGIEALLRWAGVALVTLAAIFLVSTAISRGWIGPELQLLGAALGGAALLGGAIRLSGSRRPWSLALGCGGSVVLAACALATHEWLDLVGPGVAVALVAAATVISVAVAVNLRLEGIALTAGLVAMIAPLDTLDNFGDGAVLAWVTAYIVGSSALGLVKIWPGVRLVIGWLGAALLLLYSLSTTVDDRLQVMGFIGAALITVTLWGGPTLARRRAPSVGSGSWGSFDWQPLDYRLVAIVPFWTWGVVAGLLGPIAGQTVGLIAILTALGFLAVAALGWRAVEHLVALSTTLGSLALLTLGFALYLEGPALMVALAGQAATSYYLGRKLDDKMLSYAGYGAGALSSALAVGEMVEALDTERFAGIGAALSTLLVVGCWIGTALALYRRDARGSAFEPLLVGAWAGVMLWLAAVLIGAPQGLVLISVAWAIMACAGLVIGLSARNPTIRNVAMGTLGITLFKLVTIDMSEVEVFWRVGLFFVVGTGLIALGLKVPSLIEPATEYDTTPDAAPDQVPLPGQGTTS